MVPNPRERTHGGVFQRDLWNAGVCQKCFPKNSFCTIETGETSGSRSLQRQKDAVMVSNPKENSREGRISRETSGKLAYVGKTFPRIASARSNTRETYCSNSLQRQRETSMAPNPRENSRGGRASREKCAGETSPTESEISAEMAQRLFMQESLYSLPGSVPSGPDDGLVREPLCQEDTCHNLEHTTSHQNQLRISELNRIWDDRKSSLAEKTSKSLYSEWHGRRRNWSCSTMVGWEVSQQESVAPWCYHRSITMTSNTISRKSRDGNSPTTSVSKEKSRRENLVLLTSDALLLSLCMIHRHNRSIKRR